MSVSDAYTDVVELCALLQCLGFSVKSLDTSDTNISQDGGTRTVVINCQSSGLHVVLESVDVSCSCPANSSQQNSGFWQVSGVAGGKQLNKEYGSALLGSLPKTYRERLTKQLQDIVRSIKVNNESEMEKSKDIHHFANKSVSMIDMKTPEKRTVQIKSETPQRYRSLDTLTTEKEASTLPAPRPLQKQLTMENSAITGEKRVQTMCQRQSTYTLPSTSGSMTRNNKTSSPIQPPQNPSILESLIDAEKAAEDLKNKLSSVIKEYTEDGKLDSSMSSLVLDVSKISILKGGESSRVQFASSPNLSGFPVQENLSSRLRRIESSSTSNLASVKTTCKDVKPSKLRRISPNIFKFNKKNSSSTTKLDKVKCEDKKNTSGSVTKPKVVMPARTPKSEASPNLSASRKRFSHVKSTIPRPMNKKD